MTTTHVPVLIVGGGIGGLATALAVARSGRAVHLLEQASEFTEIGAGLQIGPNATRVLDRLGLLDQLLEVSVLPRNGVMLDAVTGEPLTVLDLGQGFRDRYGYPYVVVHRSDLLGMLVAACRAERLVHLENDRQVVEVWSDPDSAGVRCADGSTYTTDLLIGADGLRSKVRTLISNDEPVYSGFSACRGTVPMSEVRTDVAENDVVLWVGPGMHLIQYPVRRGEVYNQVAVFRNENPADFGEEMRERFSKACAPVQGHAARIARDRNWPIYDRDPLPTWISGRAVLLGDAAHPMLQYLGQGACQALEDALALGQELARHDEDVDKALVAYQDRRLPKATRCQLSARPWGEVWHSDNAAMLGLRSRVMRSRSADDYTELDWLYAAEEELAS
ncbi:salicylate hydroxylase [Planotetraspora silvatica]|uniref:Salicylate hydroxylase n=1 Tax=Planotetraspora silvatica TaxID=234614 RepID=A0A8J3UFP1_9ACTN|nr:FAD-dependent monooxygenase [Planotetraspora silvatica]GII43601.1 salicylate hydroxylase [Planotetraspora silvatica]